MESTRAFIFYYSYRTKFIYKLFFFIKVLAKRSKVVYNGCACYAIKIKQGENYEKDRQNPFGQRAFADALHRYARWNHFRLVYR
jgi:hypothetical protein